MTMVARTVSSLLKRAAAGVSALALSVSLAAACAFHTYTPDPTMVDRLMGIDALALARPDPDRKGHVIATETLLGPAPVGSIPLVLEEPVRVALQEAPGDAVAIISTGYAWEVLRFADADLQDLLTKVVPHLPAWEFGGDDERAALFAGLLDHPNPDIRRIALEELDAADYSILRGLNAVPPQSIEALSFENDDLRPIRVLLTGLSGDTDALPVLRGTFEQNIGMGLPYLGAYVIALIEIQGVGAAQEMAATHLRDAGVDLQTKEKILEAFAILSRTADDEMAAALREMTTALLADVPTLAPAVARQFGFQGDWSQGEALAAIAKTHRFPDIADLFAVSQYVALAQGQMATGQ